MSNQQIFPNSSYPSAGDILTTPGSPDTVVVGIQTFPFSSVPPLLSQVPVFDGTTWIPSSVTLLDNDSIAVAGVAVSDDYEVSVARIDTEVQVNSALSPSGFPILAAGTPVNTP
jgi:hypothetical protein